MFRLGGLSVIVAISLVGNCRSMTSESYISGVMLDCLAGKAYKPDGVDVFVFDPDKAPEIATLLHKMDKLLLTNSDESLQEYFDSYMVLLAKAPNTPTLGHVKSGKQGRFRIDGLQRGKKVIVLGIEAREDTATYYAYKELEGLSLGNNAVVLNFNYGDPCVPSQTHPKTFRLTGPTATTPTNRPPPQSSSVANSPYQCAGNLG